jgi:hypothetical protein
MRFHLLAPLVLALGACAAPAPDAVRVASAAPADEQKTECHMESDTGSMMMHKVCTRPQTEAERNATQEAMRQNLPNNSIAHPAAGSAIH